MTHQSLVESFLHEISTQLLDLISESKTEIATRKQGNSNYATETDIAAERLIIDSIQKYFPKDRVLAEETAPETQDIENGRVWIIDPICGTNNFARGLGVFVTNIALSENGKLIAGCVVDYSQQTYVWSTGGGIMYQEKDIVPSPVSGSEVMVDVDLTALISKADNSLKESHIHFVLEVLKNTEYMTVTTGSSRNHMYVALGKMDAFISPINNVWDSAAPNFLVQQSGGVISQTDGKTWTLHSKSVVASRNKAIHDKLMRFMSK